MWEPKRLTTLWAFMACYRDSFTFSYMRLAFWAAASVNEVESTRKRELVGMKLKVTSADICLK
jgi:hypothetical protein